MAIGVIFAGLAAACGVGAARALRLPLWTAPTAGLGLLAIVAVWLAAFDFIQPIGGALVAALAIAGAATALPRIQRANNSTPTWRLAAVLVLASALPIVLLGVAFAGVETPLSTHDGAFHVETIDALRRGVHLATWYPMGFHAAAAAVLGLTPRLDSARGTAELGLGLAALAPVALFGLARAFKLAPTVAVASAIAIALSWIYPYDYQLWGGWPQGMGVLLVLGVWSAALGWLEQPSLSWSVLAGVLCAAILLTHGIDLYTAALGLAVLAVMNPTRLHVRKLAWHAPTTLAVALAAAAPYVPTLLGWAHAGGATDAASQVLATDALEPDALLQFATGAVGAASALDLPIRAGLVGIGIAAAWRSHRAIVAVWLAFVVLTVVGTLPALRPVFVLTYPWLADQRQREITVILASLIAAIGLVASWRWLAARTELWNRNHARRLAIGFVLLVGFFAEGSGVSIYKRLVANVAAQDSFTADDGAAMAWLRLNAPPGSMLINDRTADAGIWAPYKADVPILLPRSASGDVVEQRAPILQNVDDLAADPSAQQQICSLHADYVYSGAKPLAFETRQLPDRATLERLPFLKEVFSSGEAAVFQIELPCADGYG